MVQTGWGGGRAGGRLAPTGTLSGPARGSRREAALDSQRPPPTPGAAPATSSGAGRARAKCASGRKPRPSLSRAFPVLLLLLPWGVPAQGAQAGNARPGAGSRPSQAGRGRGQPVAGRAPPCSGSAAAAWTGEGLCAAREMLLAASLLLPPLLLLLLLRGPEGGRPPARRPGPSPAAPQHVRFRAHTFGHLLLWAPGRGGASSSSPGLLYDVQYKRYGNHSWTPAAPCTAIARRSCDLTAETAQPSGRYFARVRAVAPDGTSAWTATGPFSPKEATLQLWNMSLSLSGNTLRVTLELPVHRGKNSTVVYEDLYPSAWSQYRVYVRRASDNTEEVLLESSQTFELPVLSWGERYCISVEPYLPSRPNPAKRTEEQCISTPPPKGGPWATAILSSALLSLMALGTLALAWVRARMKKPMETPSVLKSFRKQSSPWLQSEPWTLGMTGGDPCSEAESIHPISLGLQARAHPLPASARQSGRAACRVPEQVVCWTPEAIPGSKARSPQLRDLTDSSGCSTDSGICLQDPLDTGPRGGVGQSPGSSKEGRGLALEDEGLPLAPPASMAQPVDLDAGEALAQAVPPHAQVPGCQRQAGGPGEALGSSSCPPSPEGVAPPKPVLASGYLKQASVAVLSAPGAPADTLEAGRGPPTGSTHPGGQLSLSGLAPGGVEFLPESPKALLASSFLGQEPAWPPPHHSLLHASTHLSLSLPWCRV